MLWSQFAAIFACVFSSKILAFFLKTMLWSNFCKTSSILHKNAFFANFLPKFLSNFCQNFWRKYFLKSKPLSLVNLLHNESFSCDRGETVMAIMPFRMMIQIFEAIFGRLESDENLSL
jgi:hypothetical protein